MAEAVGMQLVFRCAGMGFALAIDELAEILESGDAAMETTVADPERGLLGVLPWRGREVEVYTAEAGAARAIRQRAAAVLILCGSDGYWGLAADGVEGIFPGRDFAPRPVPLLLERDRPLPYERLLLWRDEPLQGCSAAALSRWLTVP